MNELTVLGAGLHTRCPVMPAWALGTGPNDVDDALEGRDGVASRFGGMRMNLRLSMAFRLVLAAIGILPRSLHRTLCAMRFVDCW
jgi:hypothetical protein